MKDYPILDLDTHQSEGTSLLWLFHIFQLIYVARFSFHSYFENRPKYTCVIRVSSIPYIYINIECHVIH